MPLEFASDIEVREVMSKDSSTFDFADMDRIVDSVSNALADPACSGVVVLHGTDTMEESALLVDLFHDDPRPVVFTSDHPEPDGPANVSAAVEAVRDGGNRGRGVLVAFGGRILQARGLGKAHTSNLDAFVSAAEPRRVVPRVRIAGVRVDIVALYPGADSVAIDAYVTAGAQGIVLEATGSGNTNAQVVAAVRECSVPVVVTTRVPMGPIGPTYGGGGGGADLVQAGAVFSPLLRAGQARIALAVQIAGGV